MNSYLDTAMGGVSVSSGPWAYLHNFPNVLLSSALCRWGYWSASFRRAACAHTMKAFMGLFTCGLLLLPEFTRTGMGTSVQSYPFSTWLTASRIPMGKRSSSSSDLTETVLPPSSPTDGCCPDKGESAPPAGPEEWTGDIEWPSSETPGLISTSDKLCSSPDIFLFTLVNFLLETLHKAGYLFLCSFFSEMTGLYWINTFPK